MTEKKNRYFGLHPEGNIIAESGRYGTTDVYIPETTEQIEEFHEAVEELIEQSKHPTLWERIKNFFKWLFLEGESK